jgi:MoaA/NifB/PqqE/SkfB family radical SAM enzyme
MKIPHDKFCVLPWVSLETSPIGTVRPCCLAEEEITDDQGEKFDLMTADLSAVQNSLYMKKLREDFLQGKKPNTCRKCWNEERAGRTSKRMHTLDRLKHMITDDSWSNDTKPLMFLDLKLGNICNLKCRICGSWSSSTFAAEELNYLTNEEKKSSFHYTMLRKGAWPRENENFWNQIDQIIDQIQYIEFTGGEPFMIREHFRLLQGIVDRGRAGSVEIHYNTNGTHWPEEAEDIWRHFRTVEIAFSIDDVGDRFEYQRTNAVWSDVLENIEKFKTLREKYPGKIQLQVCSTINVFNVMYLETLASWIDQQGFDFCYWNMMHEAYYFSVSTLPDTAKSVVIGRLKSAQVTEHHRREFDRVVGFIENGASLDGNILRMKVRDLDWKRGQDLRDHHPELAEAISYAGPQS